LALLAQLLLSGLNGKPGIAICQFLLLPLDRVGLLVVCRCALGCGISLSRISSHHMAVGIYRRRRQLNSI
jgi:hypothetical protein